MFHRTCLLFTLLVSTAFQPAFADDAKPNIVWIVADDLGYGDLSMQGGRDIETKHIDALAAHGVRCTNAYVSAPVCSPTRAGLLTGRYQQRFGHEFNPALVEYNGSGQGLPLDQTTVADRLRDVGYKTLLVGKWHQGQQEAFLPNRRGFDEFFGFPLGWHSYWPSDDAENGPLFRNTLQVKQQEYLTRDLANEACAMIARHRDHPFFMYLAFNAVHTPMEAPESTVAKFSDVATGDRRTYLAMLAELDDAVGRVLNKLRAEELEEKTLIFFVSDNGGPTTKFSPNGARNGPLRGSKGDTWEGGIRVPLMAQWKGRLPAGAVYDQPVISLDIVATSLHAGGVELPAPPAIDGVDLVPYFSGSNTTAPHKSLYWRFGKQMAIRSGDWKLVRPSMSPGEYLEIATTPMLFNLRDDVGEQTDLAAAQPDKVRELQADWNEWNAELMAPRWPATLKGKLYPPAQ